MTMNDPIADMLTRIRNANTAKHDTVAVSYTHLDVYKRQPHGITAFLPIYNRS